MYKICAIILIQLVLARTRFLPAGIEELTTENAHIVEETQHAICNISSNDVKASANATITRQLKGICTTSHLDDRLNILEKSLILEVNNIKNLINLYLNSIEEQSNSKKSLDLEVDRDTEISKLNMTMQKEENGIKFNYYWKINNLQLFSTSAIYSGDFYFAGNHVYIQLFPNYLQSEQMLVQIIDLEEFHLSYSFTILDQENEDYDLSSQVLYCDLLRSECNEFKISHNVLLSRNYIKNNSLIIKLLIYLHY